MRNSINVTHLLPIISDHERNFYIYIKYIYIIIYNNIYICSTNNYLQIYIHIKIPLFF